MVVLNTKTGEFIFRPRFTEPADLNWATSHDAGHGDYIVKVVPFFLHQRQDYLPFTFFLLYLILKYNSNRDFSLQKSVSDGVIETGGYSHVITGRSSKITEVKGDLKVSNVRLSIYLFFYLFIFFAS